MTKTLQQSPLDTSSEHQKERSQPAEKKIRTRVTLRKGTREKLAERSIRYRIPMEVSCVMKFNSGHCLPVCPNCISTISREYMAFCDRCGQKLGWSKLDKATIVYPGYKAWKKEK